MKTTTRTVDGWTVRTTAIETLEDARQATETWDDQSEEDRAFWARVEREELARG